VNYLNYKLHAGPEQTIRVSLTNKANVRLLDPLNYYKYRAGRQYQSAGESTEETLVHFKPPHKGEWHVIIDLKGQEADVRASVQLLKPEESREEG